MIYAYVELTVTDPASMAAYAEKAGDALTKYDAKPVVVSAEPTLLEGETMAPGRAVILSFPDREAAMGWINDPELQGIHDLRRAAGSSRIVLVG